MERIALFDQDDDEDDGEWNPRDNPTLPRLRAIAVANPFLAEPRLLLSLI
jgi:hypothetical protein